MERPVNDPRIGELLLAMNIMGFERLDDGSFAPLDAVPAWFRAICPEDAALFLPDARFPALRGFLKEAGEWWGRSAASRLESPLWMERAPSGAALTLKASAVTCGTRHLLLIEQRECLEKDALRQQLDATTAKLRDVLHVLEHERKTRKQIARKSRILENAIKTVHLGVTITNPDRKIIYTNPADAEMHGYTVEELIGTDAVLFAPPQRRTHRTLEEVSAMKGWIRETINVRKDGRPFPVHLMSDVVRDEANEPIAIITTCEDITDRKEAEKALADERNLLRALIDNIPDLIYVKNLEGRFLLSNRAYAAFVGASDPHELHDKTAFDFFPEAVAAQDEARDQQIFQTRTPLFEHEESLSGADGAEREYLVTKAPLLNRQGEVSGLIGIGHDITAHKQSETQIAHLNAVLNAIRIVNQLIVREQDRKQLVQATCEHLVKTRGYSSAWILLVDEAQRITFIAQSGLGDKFHALLKQMRQGKVPRCFQEALNNPTERPALKETFKDDAGCCLGDWCVESPRITVKLAHADKVYGALFVSLPSHVSANQEELLLLEEIAGDMAFALYNIEVEEQRQAAERAMQKNEQWLAATLRNLSEAVVTTNEQGTVTFFNPIAEALTGWKQEELLGKDITFRVTADESETGPRTLNGEQQPEITILLGEFPILVAKDGTRIPVEYSGNPIMNEQGQFSGFVMVFKDITERKRAEEELEKSLSLLRSTLESTADGILVLNIQENTVPIFNQKFVDMWRIPEAALTASTTAETLDLLRQRLKQPERLFDILQAVQRQTRSVGDESVELDDGRVVEIVSQPQWVGGACVGTVLSFHDVTEQKRAENALHYRVMFGNLINAISTYFINLELSEIDLGIHFALQTVGEFTGVDHGYVAMNSGQGDALMIEPAHEWWADPKQAPPSGAARTLDPRFFAWANSYIEQNGLLNIPNVRDMAAQLDLPEERAFLWHIHSLLMIPLISAGKLVGLLSFESLNAPRAWSEDIIALLRIVAEIFSGAFERKQTGKALEQERKRLFALLENLPVYIFLRDPRGEIRFANRYFRKRFGEPERPETRELLEQREGLWEETQAFQVFHTRIPQGWEWYHAQNNAYYQAYDYPFTDIDGAALVMEFGIEITDRKLMELALEDERASLAQKVQERTVELSSMNERLHDEILERRQAQIELEQAKEAAESASRAKSEFLANMSHELRTPLNAILGYAQILKNAANLTERQTDGLDIIKNSGTHLLNLINEILDLSKIEAGFMELTLSDVHLPEFLKQIAEMIHIRAKQKGIDFVYTCDPRLAAGVRADEKRLRQILINLLGNAIKFTEKGAVSFKIQVCDPPPSAGASAPTQVVRFEIQDTGIGIAPDDIDEIFLPFQQVGEKRHAVEGTGLGLTISQKFVRLMNSRLNVQSALGQGTTFSFDLTLEVVSDFLPKVKPAHRKILGYSGARRTILVVDDRKENRMLLADMLIPLGFHIIEAENGLECLEQLRRHRPDATLLDLRMPVMNGIDAVEEIRRDDSFREHVIIAVSASVYEDDRHRSLDAGCHAFLIKPVHLDELLELLREHLALEWMCAEEPPQPEIAAAAPPAAALNVALPADERDALLKLASSGRVRPLLQYLDTLPPAYQPLIDELRQHAKTFQLQAIVERLRAMEAS